MPHYDSLYDPHLVEFYNRKSRFSHVGCKKTKRNKHYDYSPESQVRRCTHGDNVRTIPIRPFTLYKVLLSTADVPNAGSSANVFITLKGEWGSSVRQKLKKLNKTTRDKRLHLRPGSTHTFYVISPDLGEIRSILLEYDGMTKEDSWLLESAQVLHPLTRRRYMFLCNHWFSLYKEDGRVERELLGVRSVETKYTILVVTGDQEGCGTDSNVFVTIHGRTGITPRIELAPELLRGNGTKQLPFTRGTSSTFTVRAPSVGALTKIRISQNASGRFPHWFIERVVVTNLAHPKWTYYFNCSFWLSATYADGKLSRLVRGFREPTGLGGEAEYRLTFYTSDRPGAGTTADVFVQLHGEVGTSREMWLNDPSWIKEHTKKPVAPIHFPRGSRVQVHLAPCQQYGYLKRLTVGHNNRGESPSWCLEKVIVDERRLQRVFEFPCRDWIGPPWSKQLYCSSVRSKDGYQDNWHKVPLEFRILTGDSPDAGTTSRVFIQLQGPEEKNAGESQARACSERRLSSTASDFTSSVAMSINSDSSKVHEPYITPYIWFSEGPFERGRTATFRIDLAVPVCISPIGKLYVGHDNSGDSPSWLLDKIIVDCPTTGMQQTFIGGCWLSKEKGRKKVQKLLHEDRKQRKHFEPKIPWLLTVFTSNCAQANTTPTVSIVLYGTCGKTKDIELNRTLLEDQTNWNPECIDSEKTLFQRGAEDVFRVNLEDIGVPYKLRVSNNNGESSSSWHLDKISLSSLNNNEEEYIFPCNRWLSRTEDDGSVTRELPATGDRVVSSPPVHKYRVNLFTRTRAGLGLRGKVCVNLVGEAGDTGERWLSVPTYEKKSGGDEQMTEFIIEAVDLKALKKLHISHDGQHPGDGWYLSRVVVEQADDPSKSTTFECHQWLDTSSEDGCLMREFVASGSTESVYHKLRLFTGTGGTFRSDTKVSIRLIGKRGNETGAIRLRPSSTVLHKEDRTNEFFFFAPDVGELQTLRLWDEGSSHSGSWFLDSLTLTVPHCGLCYTFDVHRWIYSGQTADSASIGLSPTLMETVAKGIPYEIVLFTDSRQPSDLCAFKASIQLYGMPLYRRTEFIPLSVQPEVQVNRITVYEEDVRRLQKVHISCKAIDDNKKWPVRRILIRKPVSYQAVSDHASSGTRHSDGKLKQGNKSTKSSTDFDCSAAQSEFDGSCPGLLDHSQMENYWFIVGDECMQFTGNHVAVCEIPATTGDGRLLNKLTESKYEILVKAGNGSNSGKIRSMYIILCGRESDSAEVQLMSQTGKYIQPNGVDKFELTLIGLGELRTVKIRRDEAIESPDWYLEWILIKMSNSQQRLEYLFPCYFFLSRDREDGLVSAEITPASSDVFRRWKDGKDIKDCTTLPDASGLTTFVIRVRTGTEFGARTNARVFIELFGEHGCTGTLQLANSRDENGRKKRNMFESGGMDSFKVRTDHVGSVTKIRIGHDSSGASSAWQVNQVEVESAELNRIWTFQCNRWLLPAARGQHVEAEFEALHELTRPLRPPMTFEVKVHTTETSGSPRMTGKVFLQLFGRDGEACDPVRLTRKEEKGSPFKPGTVDTFLIDTDQIPLPLQKIRLWHDGRGTQPNWNVSRVELKLIHPDDQVNETMIFPCEKWLSPNEGDLALECLLYPVQTVAEIQPASEEIQPEINLRQYEIHVITGDEQNAGTDANVYLTLYGENGDSGERKLTESQTHRNKFEAGNTDIFHYDLEDLGKIYKARIRHDGSGPGASWFLSRIEVHLQGAEVVSSTQGAHPPNTLLEPTVFYCNRWLSTQHDDCSIDRILYAHDYRETESLTSLHTSPNKFSSDYPPYLSGTFIFPRSSPDKVRQANNSVTPTVPYHVRVVTGSIKHAATPGPVWIKCIGKHGEDIGKFLLFNEVRGTALRKGTTEKFVFDAPAVDALSEIEVGNESVNATETGWFLKHVQVLLTRVGKCYQFNCNTWISRTRGDKKPVKGFSIFRDQIIVGVPLITYQVMIATCDVESAGTDSDVYLQLFGNRGTSNERLVEKKDSMFERSSSCCFQMEFEDVGDLQKIRVRQDPQGERRHWKLDRVEIIKGDLTYYFETDGGQWLSSKHGDQKLNWTDLVASVNGKKQLDNADLKILVKTSDVAGAGTDCGIFMQLFGEHGDSGPWRLTECQNNPTPFKNNELDEFFLRGIPELGSIARCSVWLKQRGRQHSWHCAWIEVTELLPDQYSRLARHWRFECNRWLSLKEGDRQTAWDLPCSEEFVDDPVRGHVNDIEELQTSLATTDVALMTERPEVEPGDVVYTVEVHTGMRKNADTSNDAWLTVSGSRGTTRTLEINNSEDIPILQSGQTNRFNLFSPPVGALEKLNLGLIQHQEQTILSVSAPTDMRNHDSHWFCEWVKVRDPVSRRTYIFQVNKWIEATKRHSTWTKMTLDVTEVIEDPLLTALQTLKARPIIRYKVSVYTGSRLSGGTDANVYITLFAEQPGLSSGRRALKRDGRNLFERNNLDEFQIHCIDLGKLTHLRIEHDNTSTRTDWFLDKVRITNMDTGATINFPCEQWLSKKRGDGRLWKELFSVPENI
ncbi:hypothetical protein CRM22_005460 [Opisthorchis felineus]|uniref:PLAT domain-containing protein n=1 Tax=Opisthorchis felineus TaxID=147828 RepID=A0A4S2LXU9_OPIFE|nr:hypothetical protein CRM22_005460 [Opisthorchis felineus]